MLNKNLFPTSKNSLYITSEVVQSSDKKHAWSGEEMPVYDDQSSLQVRLYQAESTVFCHKLQCILCVIDCYI